MLNRLKGNPKKYLFNADLRRLSRQTINLEAESCLKYQRLAGHVDTRRFYRRDNLRLSAFYLQKSAFNKFSQGKLNTNNFIILFLFTILLSGCVTIYNPATGKKEALLIDTESEVSLGKDMDTQIQKKLKLLKEPQTELKLNSIGNRVSAYSDRRDLDYHFRVVKDEGLNAFAIPGGFIYVNSALMDISTEDELACVLAHEIGHIAARHSVKKLQATMAYELLRGIAIGVTKQETVANAIDAFVFNPVTLAYSRQDELLADRLAVKYVKKAGLNPYGMITFFEKLKKEQAKKGPNLRIEILSSHPNLDERIKRIKEEIELNP